MYVTGQGAQQDISKAVFGLKKAVSQDFNPAKLALEQLRSNQARIPSSKFTKKPQRRSGHVRTLRCQRFQWHFPEVLLLLRHYVILWSGLPTRSPESRPQGKLQVAQRHVINARHSSGVHCHSPTGRIMGDAGPQQSPGAQKSPPSATSTSAPRPGPLATLAALLGDPPPPRPELLTDGELWAVT